MTCRRAALGALALGALALGGRTLGAQALRIRATEETTGQPLAGAIADVVDAQGVNAAQLLLRDDGSRVVPLLAAGTYTVRIRRIGYEPFLSPPVTVSGTDTVAVALRVPARRVVLSAMRITGARRCAREASAAGTVASLLEEARKALLATALTGDERARDRVTTVAAGDSASAGSSAAAGLVSRTFRRRVSTDGDLLEVSVALPRRTETTRPFSAIDARVLSDSGYLRTARDGVTFFGPDAEVLLSDEFLRDHCFEAVSGRGPSQGLLGVRFTPAPNRRNVPDIAGTLWMDPSSAELRYLDFWYATTRLPTAAIGEGRSGGRVVFESLPGGRWIVSAWHVRMPRFATPFVTRQTRPSGYVESGGVVSGIAAPPSGLPSSLALVLAPYEALTFPARIEGAVYDSLHMRPLVRAAVALVPRAIGEGIADDPAVAIDPRVVETDSVGRYLLDSIPAGTYRLTFSSTVFDSAGAVLPSYDVRLTPGALVQGDVATPSRRTLFTGCARPSDGRASVRDSTLVFGTVRSYGDRVVANATVRASWIELRPAAPGLPGSPREQAQLVEVAAATDRQGMYRICGVPPSAQPSVVAVATRDTSGPFVAPIPALGIRRHDFTVATPPRLVAQVPSAMLRGVVRGADGALLPDVRIALAGGAGAERVATTDRLGRFVLSDLPEGAQTFSASLAGYIPLTFSAALRRHVVTMTEVRMAAVPRGVTP